MNGLKRISSEITAVSFINYLLMLTLLLIGMSVHISHVGLVPLVPAELLQGNADKHGALEQVRL